MKLVHARKRVWKKDHAFQNKFVLLVWILSLLQWKKFNYTTTLYTDLQTLNDIKSFGFDRLYDEINTTLLEDPEICKDINFSSFWATPKLLALWHETKNLNNEVVIADQDVVPIRDISRLWTNCQVAVWSNREYLEFKGIYPDLHKLSLPENYSLPKWFTGKTKPLNTGILHFKNNSLAAEYCEEAFKYIRKNENKLRNPDWVTMCNAEQRMLGEFIKHKKLSYGVMQPINEGLFNRNGFHTHGYKQALSNEDTLNWNIYMLLYIKKNDEELYNFLLKHPFFEKEKEYLTQDNYKIPKIKEFENYNLL